MSELWRIPDSWRWSTMGDVADIVGGGTPSTDVSEYFGGEIAWITPADLSGYKQKLISQGARNITDAGLKNSGARLMPAGTVLFSSRAPIGYVAIAANPVSTNQGFKSFLLREGLSPDYVYYYLQRGKQFAIDLASGTTFLEISGKKAAQIPIPVAPMPEQHRIVAEIEKQFTRLDAGMAALRRVQANLKRYRASVLKAACEGKLVPTEAELARAEGREYESGAALLERILAERRASWAGRGAYKEPAAPDVAGLPVLPEGWCWADLGRISLSSSYGTSAKCAYDNSGPPVLRIPNIRSGRVDLTDLKYAGPTEQIGSGEELAPGDLLIIRTNGSKSLIGRSAVVHDVLRRPTTYASYLIRFRLANEPLLFGWLSAIWDCEPLRAWIESHAATTAGQYNISMSVLSNLPIPLPPTAEQQRIVEDVERRLSVIDGLEAVVATNMQRAARLRLAVLQRAFSGELIDQDPSDSSVSLVTVLEPTPSFETKSQNQEEHMQRRSSPRNIQGPRKLIDLLRENGAGLSPEELYRLSGRQSTIEEVESFYEELRMLLKQQLIKEVRLGSSVSTIKQIL